MRRGLGAGMLYAGLIGATLVAAGAAQAQTGWFLLLEGQTGPISANSGVTFQGLTDTTEILSYGQNFLIPIDAQGVPGPLSFRPLRVLKLVDGASPRLAEALATGETITSCVLTHYQAGTSTYEIILTTPRIVGVAGGGDSATAGAETISILFQGVKLTDIASGQTTTIP